MQRSALRQWTRILSGSLQDPESFDWHLLDQVQLRREAQRLQLRLSPSTTRRYFAAMRGVIREAWRLELIDEERRARLSDLGRVRGGSDLAGRSLDDDEVEALCAACADGTGIGVRDLAVVWLLYGCGLRRQELVDLPLSAIAIRPSGSRVTVHGKGERIRRVPMPPAAVDAVVAWLEVRGREAGPLVLAYSGVRRPTSTGLTGESVAKMLQRRSVQAELEPVVRPHDLRRTCATHLMEAGVDPVLAQRLLGHRHLSTTARYDRREYAALEAAMERRWATR